VLQALKGVAQAHGLALDRSTLPLACVA